jgi:hypothetical protein
VHESYQAVGVVTHVIAELDEIQKQTERNSRFFRLKQTGRKLNKLLSSYIFIEKKKTFNKILLKSHSSIFMKNNNVGLLLK